MNIKKETPNIDKKKYWLKLDKNFLQSPKIRVIKSMQNGKDYIIFYLSLMLESIETVGHLKFTSLVPYNDEMLSSLTDTNIDIVRSAVKIFCELGLMKIFDDGTIFLPDVPSMTGKESESAERVRNYRKRLKEKEELLALQCNTNVTKCNDNIYKDKDKDKYIYKEKEKDIQKEKATSCDDMESKKHKSFCKPTVAEIQRYCSERNNNIDPQYFFDFYESKGWYVGKNKMKDWKACVRTWERKEKENAINKPKQTKWELVE